MRDITIGQYYQTDSLVHRLDPRVKLFWTLMYIVGLFVAGNIAGYAMSTIFLIVVIRLSKVPVKKVLSGLKSICFILVFSGVFTLLFTGGEKVLGEWWIFTISVEGILKAVEMVYRLLLLLVGSSIMTLTTTPTDIADGLEKAFSPLRYIKIPVHEIAMMISIAFRFIPILVEEADKIMKAQKARGADFESGGIIKKAKSMIPLLVPLLISAIKRAMDLANAMEARCYRGGDGRTKMKPLKYKKADYVSYVIIFVVFIALIGSNIIMNEVLGWEVIMLL
ncbi:MAG: energy-coupling factor transporter transmembrane protein EcfT [Lachnospiraceae bacterium]|nr:energy-coupling factor transporter transmembrane protein EcfT [Lachnospiraceae bacterium]